jgi:HSP20 family protein
VSKESSQGRGGQQSEGRGLTRRGEVFPNLFSIGPREFFSLNPMQLMRRFTEEMDHFFGGHGWAETGVWAPPIEVRQEGNQLIINAELPGMNKEDVKVEATDEGLVIQGERKRQHEEKREGFYRSERTYGRFYRLIPIPEGANIEHARANYNNGVLEITVPVPQAEQKRREIPVESGAQVRTLGGGGGA